MCGKTDEGRSWRPDSIQNSHRYEFTFEEWAFNHYKCTQDDICWVKCIDNLIHIDNLDHNHKFLLILAIYLFFRHHRYILGCISMSLCSDNLDHKYNLPNNHMKLLQHENICKWTFWGVKWSVKIWKLKVCLCGGKWEDDWFRFDWILWGIRSWKHSISFSQFSVSTATIWPIEKWHNGWSRFWSNIVSNTFM